MKHKIAKLLNNTLVKLNWDQCKFEITKSKHADFSSNIAFLLAKHLRKNPFEIGVEIANAFNQEHAVHAHAEVVKPAFLNFYVTDKIRQQFLQDLLKNKKTFGKGKSKNRFVNIEYVSANPTGYLHVGHARNAAIGATLANVNEWAGFVVDREYLINDAGSQMQNMGLSIFFRYRALYGNAIPQPKEIYQGNDIIDAAKAFYREYQEKYLEQEFEEVSEIFVEFGRSFFLRHIKEHLKEFGAEIDIFHSERTVSRETIDKTIKQLKHVYKKDNAVWFKSTFYGDDKDRVLIKSNNQPTYFAPDVVYHDIKARRRKYSHIVDILGADHSGYVARIRYAVQALGFDKKFLHVVLMQLVKLTKDGSNVKMSKRAGTAVTLKSLIDEIGVDAARYFLVSKMSNTEIEIDLNLVTKKSRENPVYYVQYAHARAESLLKKASINNFKTKVHAIKFDETEQKIVAKLMTFPDLIQDVALNDMTHLLCVYVYELSQLFHFYYNQTKILQLSDHLLVETKLAIVEAVQQVIRSTLLILGVTAPKTM